MRDILKIMIELMNKKKVKIGSPTMRKKKNRETKKRRASKKILRKAMKKQKKKKKWNENAYGAK
jgi:hypothetical protein